MAPSRPRRASPRFLDAMKTLRAYESKNDAYRVFRHMLESGNPPDDWDNFLAEARQLKARLRRGS